MARRKRNTTFGHIQRKPKTLWIRDKTIAKTDRPHDYETKINAMVNKFFLAGLVKPGEVYHNMIYHDEDCPIYSGGRCNCDPDIEILTDDEYQAKIKAND